MRPIAFVSDGRPAASPTGHRDRRRAATGSVASAAHWAAAPPIFAAGDPAGMAGAGCASIAWSPDLVRVTPAQSENLACSESIWPGPSHSGPVQCRVNPTQSESLRSGPRHSGRVRVTPDRSESLRPVRVTPVRSNAESIRPSPSRRGSGPVQITPVGSESLQPGPSHSA